MKAIIGIIAIMAGAFLMKKYLSPEQALSIVVFVLGCILWLDAKIEYEIKNSAGGRK